MDPQILASNPQIQASIDSDLMSNIVQLERKFCSNFSCCNIVLPDLHALFDHYAVHDPSIALPLLCSIPSSSSPPSSPRAQAISVPTQMAQTQSHSLFPAYNLVALQYPFSGACSDASVTLPPQIHYPDAYAISDYPTYEHCYRAATSSPSRVSIAATSVSEPFQPQPQPLATLIAESLGPLLSDSPPSSAPSSPSSAANSDTSLTGSRNTTRNRRGRPIATISPPSAPLFTGENLYRKNGKRKGKVDLSGVPLATTRNTRRSKKAYPCPTPGCTKSYLNPNGLKYHQEKGTCKIEGAPPAPLPIPVLATPQSSDESESASSSDDSATGPVPFPWNLPRPPALSRGTPAHVHTPNHVALPRLLPQNKNYPVPDVKTPSKLAAKSQGRPRAVSSPLGHQHIYQPQPRFLQNNADTLTQWTEGESDIVLDEIEDACD